MREKRLERKKNKRKGLWKKIWRLLSQYCLDCDQFFFIALTATKLFTHCLEVKGASILYCLCYLLLDVSRNASQINHSYINLRFFISVVRQNVYRFRHGFWQNSSTSVCIIERVCISLKHNRSLDKLNDIRGALALVRLAYPLCFAP